MHSRVFKLQSDFTKEFCQIKEGDYEENGFVGGIADYVQEENTEDTVNSYNWLQDSSLGKVVSVEIGEVSKETLPDATLTVDREKAREFLEERAKEIVERFISEGAQGFGWEMREAVGGAKFGFYFDIDGSYYTDVEFLSYCLTYKPEETRYIKFRLEGTLDYHS